MKMKRPLHYLRLIGVISPFVFGSFAPAQEPPAPKSATPNAAARAAPAQEPVAADNASEAQPEVSVPPPSAENRADNQPTDKPAASERRSRRNDRTGDGTPPAEQAASEQPAPDASAAVTAAVTAPPTDDKNYDLLGEFVGEIETETGREPLGLQVRPIGNDRFEARQYTGGLPGQEKFSNQSQPLLGQRSGDFVILSGGPWAIFVDPERCLVIDRQGKKLGELERIERTSPSLGAKPPEGAIVLFDGSGTDQFSVGEMTEDGLLLPGSDLKPMFQDFNLHVEFLLPYMPAQEGQARGNSGCYLQSRYEVQILDSFSEAPTFNGCSSLYRQKAPDLNMCLPPLVWQTYDIAFTAPRWASDGSKIRNARITVWHNGVKTHDDAEIETKTGAGKIEEPTLLPIKFQNHKDPVRFRNIWIIDRGLIPTPEFPVGQDS